MKIRFLPLLLIALLVSAASSEARARRHRRAVPSRAEATRDAADSNDSGGPLARSRGLSQAESAAVGAVLAEIANSHATAADAAAAAAPARRLSPDYYRVYSHRTTTIGTTQRVAVKPAGAPSPANAAKPVAATPPPVKVAKVAPAPTVVAKPPVTGARMAFAPRKAAAKTPPPAPQTPRPNSATPIRAVFRD